MVTFAFLLKTYSRDLLNAQRLIKTMTIHNKDKIPLYVVLPESDILELKKLLKETDVTNIHFLNESIFADYLVNEPIHNLSAGYINQEIIKLAFHEQNLCENYFCLDSDSFFIRDFYVSDFMFSETEPYSVLFEDKELQIDPFYYNTYWKNKSDYMKAIMSELEMPEKKWLNCHGFQVFSNKVLTSLKKDFMDKRNYNYKKLMEIAPFEFSWYNYYLQKTNIIPIHFCNEIFHYMHIPSQHIWALISKSTIEDFSRAYVGLIINSNTSKKQFREYDDMSGYWASFKKTRLIHALFISLKTDFFELLRKLYHLLRK